MAPLKRFRACTGLDFMVDQHIHSEWTDGKGSIDQIQQCAKEAGLNRIAITDHVRRTSTYWEAYLRATHALTDQSGLSVLAGFEAKIVDYDGNLDIAADCAREADFLIGSVHSLPGPQGFMQPHQVPHEILEKKEYELSLALIRSRQAPVLGHPGGMSLAVLGKFNKDYMEEIIQTCASQDVAFEINAKYHEPLLEWLLEKLFQYNPPVSLGSDAHDPIEIGKCAALMKKRWKNHEKA